MKTFNFLNSYTQDDETLVTLERYQGYYEDALEAREQLSKTRQLILESRSLNDRELRLVQQGALGWAKYFEIEHKVTPVLESAQQRTNKDKALLVLEQVDIGLIAIAAAILAFVVKAIGSLFGWNSGGGGGGGGGGGASGLSKNQVQTVVDLRATIKSDSSKIDDLINRKLDKGETNVDALGLKALGMRGEDVELKEIFSFVNNLEDLAKHAETSCNIMSKELSSLLKRFKANPKERLDLNYLNTLHTKHMPSQRVLNDSDVRKLGATKEDFVEASGIEIVKDYLYLLFFARMTNNAPSYTSSIYSVTLNFEPASKIKLAGLTSKLVDDCLARCLEVDKFVKKMADTVSSLERDVKPLHEMATRLDKEKETAQSQEQKQDMKEQAVGLVAMGTLARQTLISTAQLNSTVSKLISGVIRAVSIPVGTFKNP